MLTLSQAKMDMDLEDKFSESYNTMLVIGLILWHFIVINVENAYFKGIFLFLLYNIVENVGYK